MAKFGPKQKERTFIESWAGHVKNPMSPDGQGAALGGIPFTPEILERTDSFLSFYSKRLASIDARLADIRSRRDGSFIIVSLQVAISFVCLEYNAKVRAIDLEMPSAVNGNTTITDVHLLLQAEKPTKVVLDVSYVITGARWFASYDARVASSSDKLDMTYYGTVHNNTDEDWTNVQNSTRLNCTSLVNFALSQAEVSLSTAQPSIGGQPPTLFTKQIHLQATVRIPFFNSLGFFFFLKKPSYTLLFSTPRYVAIPLRASVEALLSVVHWHRRLLLLLH